MGFVNGDLTEPTISGRTGAQGVGFLRAVTLLVEDGVDVPGLFVALFIPLRDLGNPLRGESCSGLSIVSCPAGKNLVSSWLPWSFRLLT